MQKGSTVCIVFLLLAVLGASPTTVHAQATALYDSFSGNTINPEKWLGLEGAQGAGAASTEFFRGIASKEARQLLRAIGSMANDTSATAPNARLRISHPKLVAGTPVIRILEARLKLAQAGVGHCAGNTALNSRVRAQLFGVFFNDGTGNNRAGDRTGDVTAGLQKVIDSALGRRIEAFVNRCTDAACTQANVAVGNTLFARSWAVGEADVMSVRWDPGNNQFVFAVSGPSGNETLSVGYSVGNDSAKPKRIFHDIAESFTLQNCTAGAVEGFMDLRVDNVRLDEAAINAIQP